MAELRYSGERSRGASGSSPVKREDASAAAATPFLPSSVAASDHDLDRDKDPHRATSPFILSLPSPLRSLLSLEDPRSPSASFSYRILIAFLSFTFFLLLLSIPSIWKHLVTIFLARTEILIQIRMKWTKLQLSNYLHIIHLLLVDLTFQAGWLCFCINC